MATIYFDENNRSRQDINTSKNIINADEYLKARRQALKESMQNENAAIRNNVEMTAKLNSYDYTKNREKVRVLQETLKYNDKISHKALEAIVESVVLEALPLNKEEYAKMNPNYETFIKETVESFLDNGKVNINIANKYTNTLIESFVSAMPAAETGVLMEEIDLLALTDKQKQEIREKRFRENNKAIDKAMKELAKDAKKKISKILKKEFDHASELQQENDAIAAEKEAIENPQPEVQPIEVTAMKDGSLVDGQGNPVEAMDDGNGGLVTADGAPVIVVEAPQEDPYADTYEEAGVTPNMEQLPDGSTEIAVPNSNRKMEISIKPDGNVKINIKEHKKFIQDPGKTGLLECLAVNEGMSMINAGKSYDGDLALANAITYVTILETLDATGIMKTGNNFYRSLCERSYGKHLNY